MGRSKPLNIGMIVLMLLSLFMPLNANVSANAVTTAEVATPILTVEEAIANNKGMGTVNGYIVGHVVSGVVSTTAVDDYNFAIASQVGETDKEKMVFVQLPASLRAEWGLNTNPDLIGKQVHVTGSLETYAGNPGIKSTSSIVSADGGEVVEPSEPTEVALSTITEARATTLGEIVKVKGTVTSKLKNSITIQDEGAGIAIRPTSLDVQVGDEVTILGKVAEFKNLMQIDNATLVEKATSTELQGKVILGSEIGESVESQLVTVNNVILSDKEAGTGWANFVGTVNGAPILVRDENDTLGLQAGMVYDSLTGIVQQYEETYQFIPRSAADVVEDSTVVQPVAANPASGTFIEQVEVNLSTRSENADIYYTVDGTGPTATNGTLYTVPLVFTDKTKPVELKVVAVRDDVASAVQTYKYTITDSIKINQVQGDNHVSPLVGQMVEDVEGIVTYKYVISGSTYYHIQSQEKDYDGDKNTSEAVVLYAGKDTWNLKKGDLVKVTGTVSEYAIDGYSDRQTTDLKTTQINIRNDQGGKVEILQEDFPLPDPYVIDETNLPKEYLLSIELKEFNIEKYAGDFWESREAMLVEVENVKSVSPQMHGDLTTVLESRATETENGGILLRKDKPNADIIQFRLEPNGAARDFEVATGDKFEGTIVGVVGYSFQNYKIYVSLDEMKAKFVKGDAKRSLATIEKQEDKLTIGSYNIENYAADVAQTSNDKSAKLAKAFVEEMKLPDIIGLIEVQDNNGPKPGGSEANETYERLIADIVKAGGLKYEYVNIDPENNMDGGQPDGNIRNGYLYNPERVSLKQGVPHGDATTAVGYENNGLTLNPGLISPGNEAFNRSRKPVVAEFTFQGEDVILIANHWNSKGGDTPLFGAIQPPVYKSEIQRKKIATLIRDFVADVKTKNPKANVVALGDFNDFQFAESVQILEGDIMTNLVNKVPEKDRYSYVFQGNSQVLDHILVSNNLAEEAEINMLHVNADFTDMAGRASDHDPVLVQLALEKSPKVDPTPDPVEPVDPTPDPVDPVEPVDPKPDPVEPEKPTPVDPPAFTDIDNTFAKKEIIKLVEMGIVNGRSETSFAPKAQITRAEYAVLLARALDLPLKKYEGTFDDVPTSKEWALASIEAAARAGIISGMPNDKFAPDTPVTREQIAAMVIRAVNYQDSTKLNDLKAPGNFKDHKTISPYAKDSVYKAHALGIIVGSGGEFKPKDNATRAEGIAMLYRALDKLSMLE